MAQLKRFYGKGLPNVNLESLSGQLIVVEGADGSGRSTHINLLRDWLERRGYPTANVGLKRSMLVSRELEAAMQGNILGITRGDTLVLLAATVPVLLAHTIFYKEFLFVSFDRETARTLGYNIRAWDLALYLSLGVVIAFAMQFAGVPMNLLGERRHADFVNTGEWSKKAIAEFRKFGEPMA